jgi:hypothetical protein
VLVKADLSKQRGEHHGKAYNYSADRLVEGGRGRRRVAVVPMKMNQAAASKVGASLVTRKLMREVRSKPGMLAWQQDEDGRGISLSITRAGRNAIGVDEDGLAEAERPSNEPPRETEAPSAKVRSQSGSDEEPISGGTSSPRAGTKQAVVIAMLCAPNVATLNALVEATGLIADPVDGHDLRRLRGDDPSHECAVLDVLQLRHHQPPSASPALKVEAPRL